MEYETALNHNGHESSDLPEDDHFFREPTIAELEELSRAEENNGQLFASNHQGNNVSNSLNSVDLYYNDIAQIPLLTFEEEKSLAYAMRAGRRALSELEGSPELSDEKRMELQQLIHDGEMAQQKFIKSNTKLPASIAKQYKHNKLTRADFIQEGNIGLMRAVQKYNPDLGFKFSTYATWWIKQAMGRAIQDHGRTIRVPAHLQLRAGILEKARQQVVYTHEEPTIKQLAIDTKLTEQQVKNAFIAARVSKPASLDEVINDAEDSTRADLVRDHSPKSDPINHIAGRELTELFQQALLDQDEETRIFSPRDVLIISLRFGLDVTSLMTHEEVQAELAKPYKQRSTSRSTRTPSQPIENYIEKIVTNSHDGIATTLDEIGDMFGLTRERVRQIEEKILEKLRKPNFTSKIKDLLYTD